jgi:hypothetical protein
VQPSAVIEAQPNKIPPSNELPPPSPTPSPTATPTSTITIGAQITRVPIGYVRTDTLSISGLSLKSAISKNLIQSSPMKIVIPAIRVSTSKFMKVGIDTDGWMEVPPTASAVAWFTGSPSPGELGPSITRACV